MIGYAFHDHGIGTHYRAHANGHARADDHVLAKPGSSFNKYGLDLVQSLSQYRFFEVLIFVNMVGYIDVAGQQHMVFQNDASYCGDDARASAAAPFADGHGHGVVPRIGQGLEPGAGPDKHAIANGDPLFTLEANGVHQDGLAAEIRKSAGNKQ